MNDTVTAESQGHPASRHEFQARRNDRDHGNRISSGPAVIAPHQKAGHMTAAHQIVHNVKKSLPLGAAMTRVACTMKIFSYGRVGLYRRTRWRRICMAAAGDQVNGPRPLVEHKADAVRARGIEPVLGHAGRTREDSGAGGARPPTCCSLNWRPAPITRRGRRPLLDAAGGQRQARPSVPPGSKHHRRDALGGERSDARRSTRTRRSRRSPARGGAGRVERSASLSDLATRAAGPVMICPSPIYGGVGLGGDRTACRCRFADPSLARLRGSAAHAGPGANIS